MKKPNDLSYDMREMKEQGYSVDDIAFDFNMSCSGVYKHLKCLSEFEAFENLASANSIDVVAHFGEIEMSDNMSVIKMYKLLASRHMNKPFTFAVSSDDRTVSLDMSRWNRAVSKQKTNMLINDLRGLHIRFLQTNMFHMVSGIATNEPICVFEELRLDGDTLIATFDEGMANLMELYKTMAILETSEI